MTIGLPWWKFYPAAWRSDPKLRMCSIGARGLWIEMLSVMHEAVPRGYLLVEGEQPIGEQFAALVGVPVADVEPLLEELGRFAVFSRTRAGVIYSRRMVRDEKKRKSGVISGKKGGNPALRRKQQPTGNKGGNGEPLGVDQTVPVKGPHNVTIKAKRVEGREDREERDSVLNQDSRYLATSNPSSKTAMPIAKVIHSTRTSDGRPEETNDLHSGGSGSGNGRFSNQDHRDAWAQNRLVDLVGWPVLQAAENPLDSDHAKAVTLCCKAAREHGFGWISPEVRSRRRDAAQSGGAAG